MAKMKKKIKLYSKKKIAIVLIVLICLFVIYKFNISTKSENNDVPTTLINFTDKELGLDIDQKIELHQDSTGNYYIVFPDKIDRYFVGSYSITEGETESPEIIPNQNNRNIVNSAVSDIMSNTTSISTILRTNTIIEKGERRELFTSTSLNTSVEEKISENSISENKTSNSISANQTTKNETSNIIKNENVINNSNNIINNINTTSNLSNTTNSINSNSINTNTTINSNNTNTTNNSITSNTTVIDNTVSDEEKTEVKKYLPGDRYNLSEFNVENENLKISIELKSIDTLDLKLYEQELTVNDNDNIITVSGYIPYEYELSANKKDTANIAQLTSDVEEFSDSQILVVYDLKLKNGENEYQPKDYGQSVKVSIQAAEAFQGKLTDDANSIQILHIVENESQVLLEKIALESKTEDTTNFVTDAFSDYAVVYNVKIADNEFLINDYETTKNYYLGRNYTDDMAGTNTNKFTEDNLEKIRVSYYGYDYNNATIGTDQQRTFTNVVNQTINTKDPVRQQTGNGNNRRYNFTRTDSISLTFNYEGAITQFNPNDVWSISFTLPYTNSFDLDKTEVATNNTKYSVTRNNNTITFQGTYRNVIIDTTAKTIKIDVNIVYYQTNTRDSNTIKRSDFNYTTVNNKLLTINDRYKIGKISNTEQKSIVTYLDCAPSDNDGNIQVQLIDNPFTSRPYGYGFNGWITNQNNYNIITNPDSFQQYLNVNIKNLTIDDEGAYEIKLYVDWQEANVIFVNPDSGTNTIDNSARGLIPSLPVNSLSGVNNVFNYANGVTAKNATNASNRELNIVVLMAGSIASTTLNSPSIAYTLTNIYDGIDYGGTSSGYLNVGTSNVTMNKDLQLENLYIRSDVAYTSEPNNHRHSSGKEVINGRLQGAYYNIRFGRGIRQSRTDYCTFTQVLGGTSSDSVPNNKKDYKIVIESGLYRTLSLGYAGLGIHPNINGTMVLGNDIDRANNNNDSMFVTNRLGCGQGYTPTAVSTSYPNSNLAVSFYVKSGIFGIWWDEHGTDDVTSSGITFGGYGDAGAFFNSDIKVYFQGGNVSNLINGMGLQKDSGYEAYIYFMGGTANAIFAGESSSPVFENRCAQVTGGLVKYGVCGGSNGQVDWTLNSGETASVDGDILVYIGGNAQIGLVDHPEYVKFAIESGTVFGGGNGQTGSLSQNGLLGSVRSAHVIIDGNANIVNSVYGGSNNGYVGVKDEQPGEAVSDSDLISLSNATNNFPLTTPVMITSGNMSNNILTANGNSITNSTVSSKRIPTNSEMFVFEPTGNSNEYYIKNSQTNTYLNCNFSRYDPQNSWSSPNITSVTASASMSSTRQAFNVQLVNGKIQIYSASTQNDCIYNWYYGYWEQTETRYYRAYLTYNGGWTFSTSYDTSSANGSFTKYDLYLTQFTKLETDITEEPETPQMKTRTQVDILGGTINGNVYGGSCSQNVFGTSIVNVKGGEIKGTVYGACDNSGTISGCSLVNIEGGLIASSPTITDAIFGAGKGNSTIVNQRSIVTIEHNENKIEIKGDIYGGSEQGSINENTIVNLSDKNEKVNDFILSNISLFGGGKGVVKGNACNTEKNSNVNVDGGTYETLSVFGGCNLNGTVGGDVKVKIGEKQSTFVNEVYGSGNESNLTTDTDSIYVYLYKNATVNNAYNGGKNAGFQGGYEEHPRAIYVKGAHVQEAVYGACNVDGDFKESFVYITDGAVVKDVYGGGFGKAANLNDNTNIFISSIDEETNLPQETRTHITGNVYGGGNAGSVGKNTNITVNSAIIDGTIYGGSDSNEVKTNTNINVFDSEINNIFGGGNNGVVKGDTIVRIDEASQVNGNLFGGGNEGAINGNTNVTIFNNSIVNNIYGGGNNADVLKNTNITMNAGTTAEQIYGGGNQGNVSGTSKVNVNEAIINNSLFGGGKAADVNATSVTVLNNSKVATVFGGGDQGTVNTTTNVELRNSTIGIEGSISENNGMAFAGGNGTDSETDTKGRVLGNTKVLVDGMTISGSVFGGGNGKSASVFGETHAISTGNTVIEGSLYGGGNNSSTGGQQSSTSPVINVPSIVEIAGGTIKGDVFGGANYNVINGDAYVFIGKNAINTYYNPSAYNANTISILGTIYGGGNSSSEGTDEFLQAYKSVTGDIKIYIDAEEYDTAGFEIKESIFASGNMANSTKNGDIYIKNYGTENKIKNIVSIQRASNVIFDNSIVKIQGDYDSTSSYADEKYTLSLVDHLKIKNNTVLYLRDKVGRLGNFSSMVGPDNNEQYASVTVKEDGSGVENKNVDNRLYMYSTKNFDVSPSEKFESYGNVKGMTFFGIFRETTDELGNTIQNTGMYSKEYENSSKIGTELSWAERDFDRSYATGLKVEDYNIDGFYSVFEELTNNLPDSEALTQENYSGFSKMSIIVPEDKEKYYMWFVGPKEEVFYYPFKLTASKFSTLGTTELPLTGFVFPNATINLVEFGSALEDGAKLVDKNTINNIEENQTLADTQFGLTMKTSNSGWNMVGSTDFYSQDVVGGNNYTGTTKYSIENSNNTPTMNFYLHHSNNISKDAELGNATIRMKAFYWKDELTQGTATIIFDITIATKYFDNLNYNGAVTPGTEYELFTNTKANISTKSSFSSYFELAEPDFFSKEAVINHYENSYRSVQIADDTYVFPENTTITMIDKSVKNQPAYYYYTVSAEDERNRKTKFRFDEFIMMGSTNGKYDEKTARENYKQTHNGVEYEYECFIFIVNFENVDFSKYPYEDEEYKKITSDNSFTISLQDDYTFDGLDKVETLAELSGGEIISNTFGIYDQESTIDIDPKLSKEKIYLGDEVFLNLNTKYNMGSNSGGGTIYDTRYFDKKLGVKISLYHENEGVMELVPGSALLGAYFELDGEQYFPRADGTTRIKLADLVSNAVSKIEFNTDNASIETDDYVMVIESFGSPDGIYFGLNSSSRKEINIQIVNNSYGLDSTLPSEQTIIDKDTGHTLDTEGVISTDANANKLDFSIKYQSGLGDPYLGVSLYRRNYNADNVYENNYTLVNIKDYISDELEIPNEIAMTNPTQEQLNYMATLKQFNDTTFVYKAFDTQTIKTAVGADTMKDITLNLSLTLKEKLTTGTYKVVFTLYDGYSYKHQRPVEDENGIHYVEYPMIRYNKVGETFSYIIIKGKNE